MKYSEIPFDLPIQAGKNDYFIDDKDGYSILQLRKSPNDARKVLAGLEPDSRKKQKYILEAVNNYEPMKKRIAELERALEASNAKV